MSYNILAQSRFENHTYLFGGYKQPNLPWEKRLSQLFKEIAEQYPDILCLQEVEERHLDLFNVKLEDIGYTGIFKKKTDSCIVDGCATYIKRSVLKLEDIINVELYQPRIKKLCHNEVGVIAKLRPWSMPGTFFVVANTHLLYSSKKAMVRLAQLRVFLAEIDRVSYGFNGRDSGHLPIILTGDFNSYPRSLIIKLLHEGQINKNQEWDDDEWKDIGVTDNCQHLSVYLDRMQGVPTDYSELLIYNSEYFDSVLKIDGTAAAVRRLHFGMCSQMFTSSALSHSLHFQSVYDYEPNTEECDSTPEDSTCQKHWGGVDYMFYNARSGLRPLERLSLTAADQIGAFDLFRNGEHGSDHLPLDMTASRLLEKEEKEDDVKTIDF